MRINSDVTAQIHLNTLMWIPSNYLFTTKCEKAQNLLGARIGILIELSVPELNWEGCWINVDERLLKKTLYEHRWLMSLAPDTALQSSMSSIA